MNRSLPSAATARRGRRLLQRDHDELLRLPGGLGHADDLCDADRDPKPANCGGATAATRQTSAAIRARRARVRPSTSAQLVEWNETIIAAVRRGLRDGSFDATRAICPLLPLERAAAARSRTSLSSAMIAEPRTVLLVIACLLGLAGWRSVRSYSGRVMGLYERGSRRIEGRCVFVAVRDRLDGAVCPGLARAGRRSFERASRRQVGMHLQHTARDLPRSGDIRDLSFGLGCDPRG